jgi:hypothetical protein
MSGDVRLVSHAGRRAVTGLLAGFGVVALVVGVATGNVGAGAAFLTVLVAYAAALQLGGRNAAVRLLRGDGDERDAAIINRANAVFVTVIASVAVCGSIVEQVAGDGPGPFTVFCVATAVFYSIVLGVLWVRG